MVQQFPRSSPDRKSEADCLLEEVLTEGLVALLAPEDGEDVVTVLGGVFGQVGSYNRGAGRHHVGKTDHLTGGASGFNLSGPAGDERHSMATFPLIAFHTAPGSSRVVLVIVSHVYGGGDFGPVVTGENDEGVVGEAEALNGFHQFADDVVVLEDKIAMGPGVCFALETIGGE